MPSLYETTTCPPAPVSSTKRFSEHSKGLFVSLRKQSRRTSSLDRADKALSSKSNSFKNPIPTWTTQSPFAATTSQAPVTRRPAQPATATDPFASSNADPRPSYSPPAITIAASPYPFLTTSDNIFLYGDSSSKAGSSWCETSITIASVCTAHNKNGIKIYSFNAPNLLSYQNNTCPNEVHRFFDIAGPGGGTPTGTKLNPIPSSVNSKQTTLFLGPQSLEPVLGDAKPWWREVPFVGREVYNKEKVLEHPASGSQVIAVVVSIRSIPDGAKTGNPRFGPNATDATQSTVQPSLSSQDLQNKQFLKLTPPSCVTTGPTRTATPATTSAYPPSASDRPDRWVKQIVQGLSNIHEAGFIQGDFTLSNIVVDEKDEAQIVDISRGGCPTGWESPETVPLVESGPSLLMEIGITSDLYQLGMVLWAMATEKDEPERQLIPTIVNHLKWDSLASCILSLCQTYLGYLIALSWIIPPAFAAEDTSHPTPQPAPIWPFNEGPPGLGSFIFAIGIAILIIVYSISAHKWPERFTNPAWGWYLLGSSTISCFCIMSDGTASLTTLVTIGLVQVYLGQSFAGMRHRTPNGRWYTMSVHFWPLIVILTVVFALLCMKTSPTMYNQNTQLPWFPFTIPCFGVAVAVCVYLGYLGKSWEGPMLPQFRDDRPRRGSF